MLLQQHLQLAIRAHNWTSFSPDKRGHDTITSYSQQLVEDMAEVAGLGGDPEDYRQKYERYFTAWLSAKSNCISSMITGGSNFPVRKAEKANQRERAKADEFTDFREKYIYRLKKANRRAERAAIDPLEEMRGKLAEAEKMQALMVEANKIVRSKRLPSEKLADLIFLDISEKVANLLLVPDYMGRIGFAAYQLTNNLANIKRMRERVSELEKKAAAETTEIVREDGIRVVENNDIDRLQIFFPGKPDADVITKLKKSAFKWSPSNGCWQRQLTANAKHAAKQIID